MTQRQRTFVVGPGVECDIDRLISTRLLVQANSGGGKSFTLRRLLEQTHGAVQQIVIDPEGEFASLRESFDYVLAARQGGDTLADPRTAKLLAERLLELGVSAIIDIYELNPHERIRFVKLFLEALVDAPKHLWHPVLVVLDEAHVYCPEKEQAESSSAVKALCSRGRKRGFCAVLATQRLSKLAKDAAAECNNKLIGRTSLDVDMARAGDELGFTKADRLVLRDLEDGEFFAFGPAMTKAVTRLKVGAVKTRHPEAGSKLAAVVPPPTDKVKALLPKLSDLPAEAEAREKTVADLKQELATARRELTEARKAQPPAPKAVEPKHVDVLTDADRERLDKLTAAIGDQKLVFYDRVGRTCQGFVDAMLGIIAAERAEFEERFESKGFQKILGKLAALPSDDDRRVQMRPPQVAAVRPVGRPVQATPRPASVVTSTGLNGPEQRIVDALGWLESIGVGTPELSAVAFLAGYTIGGGAFNNPRGALRAKGLIEYVGDCLRLTTEGRALARVPDAPLTNMALQARVMERLPGPERRILQPLLDCYPQAMAMVDLAQAAGYADGGGAFNNPRGRLRSLGLVDYPQTGFVRARDILFPESAR